MVQHEQPTSMSLAGEWEFRLDPNDVGRAEGWFQPSEAASSPDEPGGWPMIRVPAMWQVAGYPDYNGWAWYRLNFPWAGRAGQHAVLRFRGVSYWASVWLNGEPLGMHEGHFAPFEFDVTTVLRDRNTLVVRCGCPLEAWQETVQFCGGTEKRTTLGALQDWDCIPYPTRTNPSGIWRDVTLETLGPVIIRHADLATLSHDRPGLPGYDGPVSAQVELKLTLTNLEPQRNEVGIRLAFVPRGHAAPAATLHLGPFDVMHYADWPLYHKSIPTDLGDHEQLHTVRFEVPDIRLWWPWDLGTPHLYDVTIEAWLGEQLSHRVTTPFGFRTVRKGLNDPKRDRWNWALFVNDIRFFARGSNYLGDQFPSRMSRERYLADVRLAKDANMNMLRAFATVERPEFYEVCDELGLWVYQDYPLQWGGYVHTDEFSRVCQRQAAELVHLVHNHPSVFMYAGHSEPWNEDVQREIDQPMTAVIRALDPTRPAIFENGTGREHDEHAWKCGWYGGQVADIDGWCAEARAGFIGEFGAQSFPELEHLLQYPTLTDGDLEVPINVTQLELLNLQTSKFQEYLQLQPSRDPIESWIGRSQAYQAELLRAHIEAFRRSKYADINGALTFHFVDNYPGINWSIVDFWRSPKPAYDTVKKAFRPIHVMAFRVGASEGETERRFVREVWVVNDSRNSYPRCWVRWRLTDLEGRQLGSGAAELQVGSDEVVRLGQVSCTLPEDLAPGITTLALRLEDATGRLLSDNDYAIEVGSGAR
jgi:beta-mannosidase